MSNSTFTVYFNNPLGEDFMGRNVLHKEPMYLKHKGVFYKTETFLRVRTTCSFWGNQNHEAEYRNYNQAYEAAVCVDQYCANPLTDEEVAALNLCYVNQRFMLERS